MTPFLLKYALIWPKIHTRDAKWSTDDCATRLYSADFKHFLHQFTSKFITGSSMHNFHIFANSGRTYFFFLFRHSVRAIKTFILGVFQKRIECSFEWCTVLLKNQLPNVRKLSINLCNDKYESPCRKAQIYMYVHQQ